MTSRIRPISCDFSPRESARAAIPSTRSLIASIDSTLALTALRLLWRLTHPIAPESSLPAWQRLSSEAVHWLLYVLVLATTISGWLFASFRGWSVSFFYLMPLPMLGTDNAADGRTIDGLHQAMEWALLITIVVHVAAALAHVFVYRDGVMQRMLPR